MMQPKFSGITIWPFIFIRDKVLINDLVFMNHEKIHMRQQIELLVLPFYVVYIIEYVFRLCKYKNKHKAYRNISFEREAYQMEKQLDYLQDRKFWSFIKYV